MNKINQRSLQFFPKWITTQSITVYLLGLIAVSLIYIDYAMSLQFILFGVVSVIAFFYFANYLSKSWHSTKLKSTTFTKRLLWLAILLRIAYVIFSYFYYNWATGRPFMYHSADEQLYHAMALYGAQLIGDGKLFVFRDLALYLGHNDISDLGYATYLSYIYALTGKSIFLSRIVKAILGGVTAMLIYRLAKRNFGESVGRMAGIVCAIAPNLIYYCGLHLKECEMVFLSVLFIERVDFLLKTSKIAIKDVIIALLIALALFTFRTVLGIVAVLSIGCALLFTSGKVMKWGKRIGVMAFVVIVLGVGYGDKLMNEVHQHIEKQQSGYQEGNMEWRSKREGGNTFAKYASAAVFAPMIFTIPFPTIVDIPNQENQQMLNGGNFVKNIMSFFTLLALCLSIITGDWRQHTLLWAFTLGYLAVIAMSAFAQSERFHQPAYPFIMMFACYGISLCTKKNYKRWFNIWSVIIFVALIAWSWFKLKGRGFV